MTKIVIGILLCIVIGHAFAMSTSETEHIYTKIVKANKIVIAPILLFNNDAEVNASSSGLRITVNKGMLEFVRNQDEMALVLGHELAHYRLGHSESTPANEYAADRFGASMENRAGYNSCLGALVIYRFHTGTSSTHPNSYSRYAKLKCK